MLAVFRRSWEEVRDEGALILENPIDGVGERLVIACVFVSFI